jgi:hypothetical protein
MSSDVQNRKTVRRALAALLEAQLVGSGKPAQKLYRYKKSDFKGQSPVIVVTSAPVTRSKQAQVTRIASMMELEIHTFVLYADEPVTATNNPTAGNSKAINLSNTALFAVGMEVGIEDVSHDEIATISAITPNVSITVATLAYSYTTPNIYWINEELSEDQMDLLEKEISDTLMDNEINGTLWADIEFNGPTELDPVAIGGKEYNHEVIKIQLRLFSE